LAVATVATGAASALGSLGGTGLGGMTSGSGSMIRVPNAVRLAWKPTRARFCFEPIHQVLHLLEEASLMRIELAKRTAVEQRFDSSANPQPLNLPVALRSVSEAEACRRARHRAFRGFRRRRIPA
jgi:hypothetical protein